jgi:hypothetical protein
VPHHAKAGNLNNCILNAGSTGQLIIVLDCDMLPEKCMARTVAPFFYKRTSAVLREAEAAAAATSVAATAAAAAAASKSSKKSSRAVHQGSDSCTCNGSCSNVCVTVTAVPSPLEARCASSIVGDIETGDAPRTSTTGNCSSSATDSTAATMAGADAAAGATAATTAADTADTATAAAADAATAASGRPVFDSSVGLLQTPQAFYNLDSSDLLGQVSLTIALRLRLRALGEKKKKKIPQDL